MRNLGYAFLAIGLLWPLSAHAQDAQAAKADEASVPRLEFKLSLPPAPTSELSSLAMLQRNRPANEAISQKTASIAGEIGDVRMTLSASRSKREHGLVQDLLPRPTTNSFAVGGAIEYDLGKTDSIGLFGNWTKDRAKPVSLFPSRKYFTSDAQSFGVGWTHDDSFVASIARYAIGPSGSRTATERMVDLAGGGMKKANGFAFTLASLPDEGQKGLTYGFDLRQQHNLADGAISQSSAKNETIGTVFLAFKF